MDNSHQHQATQHHAIQAHEDADGMASLAPPAFQLQASPIQRTDPGDEEGEITDQEIRTMLIQMGMEGPVGGTPGTTNVSPEVAVELMRNMAEGRPPFRPELGKGGASWFVTEGNPYVGIDPAKNVSIPVELSGMSDPVIFNESRLTAMHDRLIVEVRAEAEARYRQYNNMPADQAFNSRHRRGFDRFLRRFAESRMWDQVGREVAGSGSKVGEVILEPGSRFSRTPGRFAVVADASKIQVRGGIPRMMNILRAHGMAADEAVTAAAREWARQRNVGRVQGVFRWGGRILIVVGIAADAYRIYNAENRVKETVSVAGGWTGATVFAGAFATWFAPADAAGPVAWVLHGVGTLVAGGIGYVVGSGTTETLYELIVEE